MEDLLPDGKRWKNCRPGFFLPVKVLSRLFRRLFLEGLSRLHKADKLRCFGDLEKLAAPDTFAAHLAPPRKTNWVVYAKPPLRRARGRAGALEPLHAPRGDLKPPPDQR